MILEKFFWKLPPENNEAGLKQGKREFLPKSGNNEAEVNVLDFMQPYLQKYGKFFLLNRHNR